MKRGFPKTIVHPGKGIPADDDVASRPPKSKIIRGSGEYGSCYCSYIHFSVGFVSSYIFYFLLKRSAGMKRGFIRTVVLPEEGIHADDGFLFHHIASNPPPSPQMIWRLREHGLSI